MVNQVNQLNGTSPVNPTGTKWQHAEGLNREMLNKCYKFSVLPDMTHLQTRAIFYSGMAIAILLLWFSGYAFARCIARRKQLLNYQRKWEDQDHDFKAYKTELEHPQLIKKYRKRVKWTCGVCLLCSVLSASTSVMVVLAGIDLQFCHGEDLFFLVWSFWPLLSLGAVVAQFGTVIYLLKILCRKRDEVPWGTAMGTPVLVFATIGYYIMRAFWKALTWCCPMLRGDDDSDIGFPRTRDRSDETAAGSSGSVGNDEFLGTDAFVEADQPSAAIKMKVMPAGAMIEANPAPTNIPEPNTRMLVSSPANDNTSGGESLGNNPPVPANQDLGYWSKRTSWTLTGNTTPGEESPGNVSPTRDLSESNATADQNHGSCSNRISWSRNITHGRNISESIAPESRNAGRCCPQRTSE